MTKHLEGTSEGEDNNKGRTPDEAAPTLKRFLAGLAVLSLGLNVYLAWDKLGRKAVDQPGPQISRIAMSGLSTDIVRQLIARGELVAQQFPNPTFAITPAWQTLITDLETLPAIRLRQKTYRFLVLQNRTSSTYVGVALKSGDVAIADVGTLDGGSSILVFYAAEEDIAGAEVTYKVRGARTAGTTPVPARPRDSVVLLSELSDSDGDLRRLGNLEGNTERLNELLNALRGTR